MMMDSSVSTRVLIGFLMMFLTISVNSQRPSSNNNRLQPPGGQGSRNRFPSSGLQPGGSFNNLRPGGGLPSQSGLPAGFPGLPSQGGFQPNRRPSSGFPSFPGLPSNGLPSQSGLPSNGLPSQSGLPSNGLPSQSGFPSNGLPSQSGLPSSGLPSQSGLPSNGFPSQSGLPSSGFPSNGIPSQSGLPSNGRPSQSGFPPPPSSFPRPSGFPSANQRPGGSSGNQQPGGSGLSGPSNFPPSLSGIPSSGQPPPSGLPDSSGLPSSNIPASSGLQPSAPSNGLLPSAPSSNDILPSNGLPSNVPPPIDPNRFSPNRPYRPNPFVPPLINTPGGQSTVSFGSGLETDTSPDPLTTKPAGECETNNGVTPGNLTCYSCKLDFKKDGYDWSHPCLGRHNGLNVSQDYLVTCGNRDIYCREERMEVNGVLITLTRECTDTCYFGCRPKGFGIGYEACANCCNEHACNDKYPVSG